MCYSSYLSTPRRFLGILGPVVINHLINIFTDVDERRDIVLEKRYTIIEEENSVLRYKRKEFRPDRDTEGN